jgi:hypothetical protein
MLLQNGQSDGLFLRSTALEGRSKLAQQNRGTRSTQAMGPRKNRVSPTSTRMAGGEGFAPLGAALVARPDEQLTLARDWCAILSAFDKAFDVSIAS